MYHSYIENKLESTWSSLTITINLDNIVERKSIHNHNNFYQRHKFHMFDQNNDSCIKGSCQFIVFIIYPSGKINSPAPTWNTYNVSFILTMNCQCKTSNNNNWKNGELTHSNWLLGERWKLWKKCEQFSEKNALIYTFYKQCLGHLNCNSWWHSIHS